MRKIIILLFSLLILTGCSKVKDSISGEDYIKKVQDLGYKVYDNKDSYDYAKSAYYIKGNDYEILYVEGNKKYDIQGVFLDECSNAYKSIEGDYKDYIQSGSGWESLKIKTNNKYYYIEYVGKTYIYIEASKNKEKKMEEFIKNINY